MKNEGKIEHRIHITDVINTAGWENQGTSQYRGSHPVHGSNTGNNTVVDTQENAAYCFRCSTGGDPLDWIALKEGVISSCDQMSTKLKGKQAVETCKLANEKYGANIEIEDIDEEELNKRTKVREVLEKAEELTHGQLQQDEQRWNRIKKDRKLEDKDIEKVKIGYWNDTVTSELEKRFEPENLVDSGLFKLNCPEEDCEKQFKTIKSFEEHCNKDITVEHIYPLLSSRVTFPYSKYGRTLYFIGRRSQEQEDYWYQKVEDNPGKVQDIFKNPDTSAESFEEAQNTWVSRKCGKYVKICETSYNNHIIWQEISDRNELVITEGIYDAISGVKAGFSVASPITTRFNSKDKKKIVKKAEDFEKVHLIFDGDTAGKDGQQETAQELTEKGIEPNVVTLEAGKDLDDWTNENGYDIEQLLEEKGERYLDTLIEKENNAEARERVQVRKNIYKIISSWDKAEAEWVFKELEGSTRERRTEWKNHKDKVRKQKEKTRKRQKLPEQESDEETDSTVTKTLEVNGGGKEIHVNKRPYVHINQLAQTATKTFKNEVGTINKKPVFKVYDVQFGDGGEENTWKLLVEPWRQLNLGQNRLPIKEADLSKEKYRESKYFKQKYKQIKEELENFDKTYTEWLKSVEGSMYIELQDKIDNRSKNTVKELSNDRILEIVQEYLQAGYYVDPKLRKIMYPQFIQHHKSKVKPGNIAKYQPHTQMWTNTKVGKSKTAQRVGRKIDEQSTAGLLGYADTDGKQQGQMDGLQLPVFLDEFNFSDTDRINDSLLPMLEEGEFEQVKAGHSIKTCFYGNLSYLANPQEGDIDEEDNNSDKYVTNYGKKERTQFELVSQFEELIDKLGMNIQAMASRFGVIVFDEEMDRAEPFEDKNLSDERLDKLEAFMDWVRTETGLQYSYIERECKDWLNKEYEEDYKQEIKDLAEDTCNEKVEKFWKNHIHSYRHARGQALRMAVYQYIGAVLKDDYSIEQIKDEAENQWSTVKEINKESLENMTNATDKDQEISRARSKIDSYSPDYLKFFTKTVIKYHQENSEDDIGMVKMFDDLKPVWNDLKHELGDNVIDDSSMYWKWSNLRGKVSDRLNQKRLDMSNDFGIELFRRSGEEMFRVKVPERFQKFYDLSIPEGGEEMGEEREGEEDEIEEGGDDTGSVNEDNDLKIEGSYKTSTSEIMDLFKDNEDKYENKIIPEREIIIYYGRKYEGRRNDKVVECLDVLSDDGRITEVDSGGWKRTNH